MFSDELKNISWEETTERIARMTDNDVRRALAKDHCDVNDFMALISPAAIPGGNGASFPQIYRGALRQDHVDVHSSLHHQFMLQLLRVLRFPS